MKQSGLGDNFYVAGYDLSNDTKELGSISKPSAHLERTGIDKSAHERAYGLADGQITLNTYFNDATGQAHPVLSALDRNAQLVSYYRGTTLGNWAASLIGKQLMYDPSRSADGDLIQAVQFNASDGYPLEWGLQLTSGKDNATGAANTTGVSMSPQGGAASTDFGLAAYLHVSAFTGTDATITIQESSDDASGDAYAGVTGGAFTQITSAPTTERIETSLTQTVEEYLRLAITTSAGFSSMDYAVMVVRYISADRSEGATA